MADVPVTDENDDNWLYGDSNPEPPENGTADVPNGDAPAAEPIENSEDPPAAEESENALDDSQFNDEHFEEGEQPDDEGNGDTQENGDTDSDDSEDDVKVIIGDVKSTPPAYPSLNIKRGGLLQVGLERQKQAGKFSVEEFETVGTINGVPAQEFNIDVLEDKPWRKPGADLTDYFNYGFNEDTWRGYCERQKRMRIHESCTGLVVLNSSAGRKMTGPIDVIGSRRDGIDGSPTDPPHIKQNMQIPVRENAIQVMTADRREYSRGKAFPDLSLPPPGAIPPPTQPDFFHQTQHQPPFYPNYQHEENNWGGNDSGWAPSEIKELTPGPMNIGPPPMCPHPGMPPHPGMGPPIGMPGCPIPHPGQMMSRPPMGPAGPYGQMNMHPRDVELREKEAMRLRECEKEAELREMREKDDRDPSEMRDRDRDRDRSRSIKPDRHREKSHRRERSRSRSRRHNKSRSRSPASRHRSKKKSSHRKDKDDSE